MNVLVVIGRVAALLILIAVGVVSFIDPPTSGLGALVLYAFGFCAGFWTALTYLGHLYIDVR